MDVARYRRQITLTGPEAQERLLDSHVAVIGAGGLGSPALLYLAGAGVGRISLIDDDVVDLSNLHRQVIHSTETVGEKKVDSAARAMAALNPDVEVVRIAQRLTWANAMELLADTDVILDGADNFDTRHIASHAAARLGIPHVWGSILGYESQMSVFWAGHGPIYEDLFPAPPAPGVVPSCAQAGVLGPVVGVTGSAMAMEALKVLIGVGEVLVGKLGYFDSLAGTWECVPVVGDPAVTQRVLENDPPLQVQPDVPAVDEIPAGATVIDVREPDEFEQFHIPGAVNVPLSRILAGENVAGPAVVHCAVGGRSAQAIEALAARGVTGLVNLRGGIERWQQTHKNVDLPPSNS
ncbi:ThiF family adenylyltransferase [Corynebacterium breve]|uniref:ThiF family adenylyltransferase n=1 Tax=Corynebacterium breve TaxID=3049799 RepID=A0ABY8VFZ0_9CORY|nr:ThiF family adenylyltransferase [Corynebacterium breve]WIM67881.1 ThiF family adenylyltransferase [Corynebacterium breve]